MKTKLVHSHLSEKNEYSTKVPFGKYMTPVTHRRRYINVVPDGVKCNKYLLELCSLVTIETFVNFPISSVGLKSLLTTNTRLILYYLQYIGARICFTGIKHAKTSANLALGVIKVVKLVWY
jgi:hypothetical protein